MVDWTSSASSPTRRQLTLLLFCVTVFIVAYSVSTSFHLIGIDYSSTLAFSSRPAPIGTDGHIACSPLCPSPTYICDWMTVQLSVHPS